MTHFLGTPVKEREPWQWPQNDPKAKELLVRAVPTQPVYVQPVYIQPVYYKKVHYTEAPYMNHGNMQWSKPPS